MTLKLRQAEKKDLMQIFDLSNEDTVRKSSFKPDEIKLADHEKWFQEKLKDKNSLILIAEKDSHFIGIIRFDMGKENIIGISITPESRGKGLGWQLVSEGLKYFKKSKPEIEKITAYIKTENIASIKTFEKAGFKLKQQQEVDGCKALKYIYNLGEINVPKSTQS